MNTATMIGGMNVTDIVRYTGYESKPSRGFVTEDGRKCFNDLFAALLQYQKDEMELDSLEVKPTRDKQRPWVMNDGSELADALRTRADASWEGYTGRCIVWAHLCNHLAEATRVKHVSDEQLASIRACWEALSNAYSSQATITLRVKAALEATRGNYPARAELAEAMKACHVQGDVARAKCEITNFSPEGAASQIEQIVQGESTNRRNGYAVAPDPARIAYIVDDVARWA